MDQRQCEGLRMEITMYNYNKMLEFILPPMANSMCIPALMAMLSMSLIEVRRAFRSKASLALCITLLGSNSGKAIEKPVIPEIGNFFGKIKYGSGKYSIGKISFLTKSLMGERVVEACKPVDFCHIRARFDRNNPEFIISIISVERVPRFTKPGDVLAYVFRQYGTATFGRPFEIADEDLEMIYTPSLSKLISKERARGTKDGDEAFDYPFYLAQEGSPINVRINSTQPNPYIAVVKVVLFSDEDPGKSPMRTNYEMFNSEAGWRINEIKLSMRHVTPIDSYRAHLMKMPTTP